MIARRTVGPQPRSCRVVQVDDEVPADVDEEDGVLIGVGDTQDPNPLRQADPAVVGHDLDAVPVAGERGGDAATDMVGEQDASVAKAQERLGVEVVGMPVREPHARRAHDGLELLVGNPVGQPPAAEVRAALDPGIRDEHRLAVVDDEGRVPDRLESELHSTQATAMQEQRPGSTIHRCRGPEGAG